MKKIIALYGAGNRGKSTTLKMVYKSLRASFELMPEKDVQSDKHGKFFLEESSDVRAIFIVNGTRVGLESQGDPNRRLEESLPFFKKNGCDVIACTSRSRGMTVEWIRKLEPEYEVEWIKKTVADNESAEVSCNKRDADKIMRIIKDLT